MGIMRLPRKRAERERFWELRSQGMSRAEIAVAIGANADTLKLWARQTGGVRPRPPATPSGRYLSLQERERIAELKTAGATKAEIAADLGRHASTIGRELERNSEVHSATHVTKRYHPRRAHLRAADRAKRPKPAKLRAMSTLSCTTMSRPSSAWSGHPSRSPSTCRWRSPTGRRCA